MELRQRGWQSPEPLVVPKDEKGMCPLSTVLGSRGHHLPSLLLLLLLLLGELLAGEEAQLGQEGEDGWEEGEWAESPCPLLCLPFPPPPP